MLTWLPLIPGLPLAGSAIIAIFYRALGRGGVQLVGVASVGLAALLALAVGQAFAAYPQAEVVQGLWTWMAADGLEVRMQLHLDALAMTMVAVVTGVGLLIHLYAAEYMGQDEGIARFFAYMNLFVAAMLILVLAGDLLLLYLGWEGVGLCSFLLIGFWYREPANADAARKAFIMTRLGDAAMAVGLLLLFTELGTLEIQGLLAAARASWAEGGPLATAAAFLLLAGAVGKSAQLPLQTWLPDAMAGPTPVSALIHAATMVTAGVYLIARLHGLFELAPAAQTAVAVLGAVTLLLAAGSALFQRDIKRVLAYSTMSQIGYMFLGLGVGAWSAAIFHLTSHAFFKALLFLSAGAVILGLQGEHDIHRMGGLRRAMPVTFVAFLIGATSLASVPLVTAGFYSKEAILAQAWTGASGIPWLWLAGLLGALMTAVYSFRVVFLVFFGEGRSQTGPGPGWRMATPMAVLALLSLAGALLRPDLTEVLGTGQGRHATGPAVAASVLSLLGILAAYWLFLRRRDTVNRLAAAPGAGLAASGWGFDRLYARLIVAPFVALARLNRHDVIDRPYLGIAWLTRQLHRDLSLTQTGQLRWYAASVAAGAVVVAAIALRLWA